MEHEEALLELLREKKQYMFEMLRMTKDTVLSEDDDDENAENFIQLMEERKEIMGKLETLDRELGHLAEITGGEPSASFQKTERTVKQEIKEMAGQLIALDKELSAKTPKIMAHLKQEIKTLNRGKNMSHIYNREHIYNEGYYVDRRN